MMEYPAGWTCEIVIVRIEQYVVRALPRPELLAMAEHIEACAECAQRVALLHVAVVAGRSGRRTGGR